MGLSLDDESRRGVDLAKQALPPGEQLDTALLLTALYHGTSLKEAFPQLGKHLPPPKPLTDTVPDKVPVEEGLQAVLQRATDRNGLLTTKKLFAAILESDAGRRHLGSRGVNEKEIEATINQLRDAGDDEPADAVSTWRGSSERDEAIRALGAFGRMLTDIEIPFAPMVGIDDALLHLEKTLVKMKRRNAIIIGSPGTGKSALVYELARRLAEERPGLPPQLKDKDIFELSPAFLRSGASMVGQYDERVRTLIDTLRKNPRIILFVDEIHSLFRSSLHHQGPFSEANESFKAAFGHGEISCIGCTTTAEYRHYIEPDGALARRFSVIKIDPPSREATAKILLARLQRLERHYAPLRVPENLIEHVLSLTEDHLPGRFQPDKSIQLLDEACALCSLRNPQVEEVTEKDLVTALEDTIGHGVVDIGTFTEKTVYEQLRERIVGQDEVLAGIARGFLAGLGNWRKTSGPRGRFLFGGPTGVGKTETAISLARILGAGREALIRVDCNTLQGSGSDPGPAINRLLGAPPGYVGYVRGQGGILSKIRDHPECIVLFDEIEKATPGIGQTLLQILDDGRVDDMDGNLLDFRRSFFIFTTNAGSVYEHKRLGFQQTQIEKTETPTADVEGIKDALRALGHGEEFLGRIDHYFVFDALDAAAVSIILEKQLDGLHQMAEDRGYELEWDAGVLPHLTAEWQPRVGVRHLTMILGNRVFEQIAVAEAQGELTGLARIHIRIRKRDQMGELTDLTALATHRREENTLVIEIT